MAGVFFWFFFGQAKKNKARRRRYAPQPKHNLSKQMVSMFKVQGSMFNVQCSRFNVQCSKLITQNLRLKKLPPILAPHQGTHALHHHAHMLHIAASRHRAVFDGGCLFLVLFWTGKKEQSPPQALCTSTKTEFRKRITF